MRNHGEVAQAVDDLLGARVIGLDCETIVQGREGKRPKPDPLRDGLRLVSLADPEGRVYIVDAHMLRPGSWAMEPINRLFGPHGPQLTGHNLVYDLAILRRVGLDIPRTPHVFDTFLAYQVVRAGALPHISRTSLHDAALDLLGVDLTKDLAAADWSGALTWDHLEYAARDAWYALQLRDAILKEAQQLDRQYGSRLVEIIELENSCFGATLEMTLAGFAVDRPLLDSLVRDLQARKEELEREWRALAPRVNPRSPQQLKPFLEKVAGRELPDTEGLTLKVCAGTLPEPQNRAFLILLGLRDAEKRLALAQQLLDSVREDGRIHAGYRQIGADTGRYSCSGPNLQQVPKDVEFRRCFVGGPGRVLVRADYSQIELRIAAEITQDPALKDAFRRGEDVHARTAREVLGVEAPSEPERSLAKALNFGLLYGMSTRTFMKYVFENYGVMLDDREAQQMVQRFFRTYCGLREWHTRTKNAKGQFALTLAGRLRRGIQSVPEALNTPVQGTGADGHKLALARLARELPPDARIVHAVHDEVIVEAPRERAEEIKGVVERVLREGMQKLLPTVPVDVGTRVCGNWAGEDPDP